MKVDKWLRYVFLGLVAGVLLYIPLGFGGNRIWSLALAQFGLFGIGVTLSITALFSSSLRRQYQQLPWIMLCIWAAWILWVGFQSMPLPAETIRSLSPVALHMSESAHQIIGTESPTHTLSIAPSVTRDHLIESTAYLVIFVLVFVLAGTRKSQLFLVYCLLVSGLMQAVYGGLMTLSGIELGLLGKKQHYVGSATGTFVNRNHFAAYLAIIACLPAGMLLARVNKPIAETLRIRARHTAQALFSVAMLQRAALTILVIGLILSRSRMGNFSFFAVLFLIGGYYAVRYAGNTNRNRTLFLLASMFVIDLLIVSQWFGIDELLARFSETALRSESRIVVFSDLVPMLRDWWLVGSGLGTFYLIYPFYRSESLAFYNEHAHNDYAQFLIETGAIGFCLVGLMVALTVVRLLKIISNRRDPHVRGIALGIILAFFFLALHSLTDFNLQIPGIALTVVALMGLAWRLTPQRSRVGRRRYYRTDEDKPGTEGLLD